MRTTLQIDDEAYRAAKALAEAKQVSLGSAVSELILRGLRPAAPPIRKAGFPIFQVADDAAPITLRDVAEALDDP